MFGLVSWTELKDWWLNRIEDIKHGLDERDKIIGDDIGRLSLAIEQYQKTVSPGEDKLQRMRVKVDALLPLFDEIEELRAKVEKLDKKVTTIKRTKVNVSSVDDLCKKYIRQHLGSGKTPKDGSTPQVATRKKAKKKAGKK